MSAKLLQSWSTLYDPMDRHSPPGSSVHGILQTRILEWALLQIFPTQWSIEPGSPALQADSLPSELPVICSNVYIFNPKLLVYPSSPSPLVIISLFSVSMGLLLHKFGGGEVVWEGKETSQTELRGKNGVNLNTEGTGHCGMLAASAPLRQSLSWTSDKGPQKLFWWQSRMFHLSGFCSLRDLSSGVNLAAY